MNKTISNRNVHHYSRAVLCSDVLLFLAQMLVCLGLANYRQRTTPAIKMLYYSTNEAIQIHVRFVQMRFKKKKEGDSNRALSTCHVT